LFPPETIQRVARYSQGVPRLINVICDNALRIAYRTRRDTVSPGVIEEVADGLRLKRGFSFVEEKGESRATPPPHVSELLWQEAEPPLLAKTALGFHQARLFSGLLLFLAAATGLLVYMTPLPAPVPSALQSPALTPLASLGALPEQEDVAAAVEEKQLASERKIDSLDRGSLPPSQTAERGEMIFKSIIQHYPQVRPLVWGLATKNPKVAIFLPETVWTQLTKEDQVSLTLFAAGLVPLIRTKPDAYVGAVRTDPRYKAFRARIARLCAECWAIGVGRPTFDEKGILFEQILVQGDAAWEKSAPGSKGVKASEFLQGGHVVSLEKQKLAVAPAPPVITQAYPLVAPGQEIVVAEGERCIFSIEAESLRNGLLRYTWLFNGRRRGRGKTWTYQPGFDEGGERLKEVKVLVADQSGGTVARVRTVRVTNVNRPPLIAVASPREEALEITSGEYWPFFVYAADPDKDDELVYTWFLNGQEVARGQQWELHMSATPSSPPEQQVKVEVTDKGGLRDQRTWHIVPPEVRTHILTVPPS